MIQQIAFLKNLSGELFIVFLHEKQKCSTKTKLPGYVAVVPRQRVRAQAVAAHNDTPTQLRPLAFEDQNERTEFSITAW